MIRSSHWDIIKFVDLDSINRQLDSNILQYEIIRNKYHLQNDLRKEFLGLEIQIESLIDISKTRLDQILPNIRLRRGIFNPLGSFIKVLTGNLDNTDAIRYNDQITKLKDREHSVEHKISIMQKAFDKLVNISSDLNFNVRQIYYKTNQLEILRQNSTNVYSMLSILNSLNQILNNFRTIYNIIMEIETAIAFSKLHTLHQSILNSTELLSILNHIEKHASLMYPVTRENLVKIERSIILKSYIDKRNLVFILEVPLVQTDTYAYYKIIPVPLYNPNKNQPYAIIPAYPYLLVNKLQYRPVASACEEDDALRYICSEDNIPQFPKTTCIEEIMLLKNNYSHCYLRPISIEDIKLFKIAAEQWLLYSKSNTVITETCHNDVLKYTFQGTFLITVNSSCETMVGNHYIAASSSTTNISLQTATIQLPEIHEELQRKTTPLDLKGVALDDVKTIMSNINSDFSGTDTKNYIVLDKISVWTLNIYIIIVAFLIIFLMYKYREFLCKLFIRNSPETPAKPSDNFSLREGGVKCATPTDINFVSPTLRSAD